MIPCRNEAANIERLATRLIDLYGPYLREIIVVNDPGTDNTSEIVRGLMAREPKVKLIDRQPPGSFGRSLRDGVEAASGRYILTMDADFVLVLPELRDLFDVVAKGHDGAIGSRFSYDSVLINYPFTKVLSNRAFHMLVKLLLLPHIRDLSNNLKIYRSEIYKGMDIEERTFAASAETGLKPLASRHDIVETPISWIGRTADMGSSSFNIVGVAPDYFMTLMRLVWRTRRRRPAVTTASTLTTGTAGE